MPRAPRNEQELRVEEARAVTGHQGPTGCPLPGNQSKAGFIFAVFPLVGNEILVEDSLRHSKQMTTRDGLLGVRARGLARCVERF